MSLEAGLREVRRRRRKRRIAVAVTCVLVLVVGVLWLNSRDSTMTCGEWQAEYSSAVLQEPTSSGTRVNLEQVRPEGCETPFVPRS
jgi:flagellar biosynthesis/type III secretory pathway M-ring protein FliF/YscJ